MFLVRMLAKNKPIKTPASRGSMINLKPRAQRSTTVLIILDGWGYSDDPWYNAIYTAKTPAWDDLWSRSDDTRSLISCSGVDVGLPAGQMGNSEVGHMTIGAGRTIHQDLSRIDQAISQGKFGANKTINSAIELAAGRRLHLIGLLSPGGVHSHEDHFRAVIERAATNNTEMVVHAILDGRDTPPRSATESLTRMQQLLDSYGVGCIGTVCGRYYAMDRDNNWDRIELSYRALVEGKATYSSDTPVTALNAAYDRNESDEFVSPTIIGNPQPMEDGDVAFFMNFRADRIRQISNAIIDWNFDQFRRDNRPRLSKCITMTQYSNDLGNQPNDIETAVAFQAETISNTLGEYLAKLDLKQLRIAETEKYAHVTYFFSGGAEEVLSGEERILIPSPSVSTYDMLPEMSAAKITDHLVKEVNIGKYDAIICNFANGDMVGHTGNFEAAIKAVEYLDYCLGRIIRAIGNTSSQCLITSDHGNVEQMVNRHTKQPITAHSTEPVPLVYFGPETIKLNSQGTLADIAPTLLDLMGLPIPKEMTGKSLNQIHLDGTTTRTR